MRLLNTQTLRLEEFFADTPPYAILSHCWGVDEVTFEDVYNLSDSDDSITDKAGWQKIRQCCQQTLQEGFHYVWIDTCCINKSSSAELSEAINSMFRLYHDAAVCFAYLADVPSLSNKKSFFRSRWFTRGWTLQELIAPREVIFLDASWRFSTTRRLVANEIHQSVGIDAAILLGLRQLRSYSVAQRFSWAARRETTRIEDQAYSLLGLFDVHMPLLYGEGSNAFLRLQEEVLRVEQDLSILAWSVPPHTNHVGAEGRVLPLAPSLTFFAHCDSVISATSSEQRTFQCPDVVVTAHSILLTTKIINFPSNVLGIPDKIAAILNCRHFKNVTDLIAMEIHPISQSSDMALMQSSEPLKVRNNNRAFFLRDRLMLADVFNVATFGVTRTILIQRVLPWSEPVHLGTEDRCTHLWLRFDDPTLNARWVTQSATPERYWSRENRTFDLSAAYVGEKEKRPHDCRINCSTQSTSAITWIHAAIVVADGPENEIVIHLRMRYLSLFKAEIEFRLDRYNPESYALRHQVSEDSFHNTSQSIQLHDGTWFVVQMRENLVTDKCIAHLAVSLEK